MAATVCRLPIIFRPGESPSPSAPIPGTIDVPALDELLALITPFYTRAARKRSFGFTCLPVSARVPFTPGRIASVFIPVGGTVYMGGDASVTATFGATWGLPIISGQQAVFGPEEGASETWLITTVAAGVTVGCLELLP